MHGNGPKRRTLDSDLKALNDNCLQPVDRSLSRLCFVGLGLSLLPFAAGCGNYSLDPVNEDTGIIGVDLGNVAVVTGDNERIEELLTEFEIPYTLFDGFNVGPPADAPLSEEYQELTPVEDLFSDMDRLSRYNILFINCGARGFGELSLETLEPNKTLLDPAIVANLLQFVTNGGELYVSDQTYPLVDALAPEAVNFFGQDTVEGDALAGLPGTLQGRVVDETLASQVGASSVWLDYPLSHWALVESGPGVLVEGDAPLALRDGSTAILTGSPLLLRFELEYGHITFSSWHNPPEVDQTYTNLQVQLLRQMGGAE